MKMLLKRLWCWIDGHDYQFNVYITYMFIKGRPAPRTMATDYKNSTCSRCYKKKANLA